MPPRRRRRGRGLRAEQRQAGAQGALLRTVQRIARQLDRAGPVVTPVPQDLGRRAREIRCSRRPCPLPAVPLGERDGLGGMPGRAGKSCCMPVSSARCATATRTSQSRPASAAAPRPRSRCRAAEAASPVHSSAIPRFTSASARRSGSTTPGSSRPSRASARPVSSAPERSPRRRATCSESAANDTAKRASRSSGTRSAAASADRSSLAAPAWSPRSRSALAIASASSGSRSSHSGGRRSIRGRSALDVTPDQQVDPALAGEPRGKVPGAGLDGVQQGARVVAVLREPPGGPAVQLRHLLGQVAPQLGVQELAEQRVIAVPLTAAVDRRQQHAGAGELRQPPVAVGAVGQRVREIAVELARDRRPQYEGAVVRGQERHHLGDQVVADRAVVAGELVDEASGIRMVAQRQRGEPERAGPALRAVPQAAGVLLGERHAGQLQHLLGLLEGQRQRRLADLGQLVAQPQPPEPQRRVGARGDHDPQRGRRRFGADRDRRGRHRRPRGSRRARARRARRARPAP